MLTYHIAGFSLAVVLDLLIGDPHWLAHPIRLIGNLVHILDVSFMKRCYPNRDSSREKRYGIVTVCIVLFLTMFLTAGLIFIAYFIHPYAGVLIEAILGFYTLAATSLKKESMLVCQALGQGNVEGARHAVSMIVGRDTNVLDAEGIAKAAVETVAENTSDGVIAPLLYLGLGGPVLAMTYKAVNTMDSMIGYHNDRYEYFGRAAAKLDDIVNFIPARLSAVLMIFTAFLLPGFDGRMAMRIFKRDRFNHKSPNSAQTESVCAGALGLELAGDASYFGKIVSKPTIGDKTREIEPKDIQRANRLMFGTAAILFLLLEAILFILIL